MNCCEKEMKDLLGALDEFVKAANKNYENVIVEAKEKGEPEEILNIVEAYVSTMAEDLNDEDLRDYLDYQEYLRSDDYLGWQYEESDD